MTDIFTECEFKYDATGIDFEEFHQWVLDTEINRRLVVSGYDTYYSKPDGDYIRHRYNSDHAELTAKKRLSANSTAHRLEVDVKLAIDQVDAVAALADLLGYQRDFTIYKTCSIYWNDDFNIVFYWVYSPSMQEYSRRVEIEATKGIDNALQIIEAMELTMGKRFPQIAPDKRLNETMFETYTVRCRV